MSWFFAPYVIKEFDGVKIAFVGMTTPNTITSSTPVYFQDEEGNFIYGFMQDETGDKLYAAVQSAVDAARAEGATYVVAMGHMGIEESCSPYMSTEVITHTTGIDAFLDGHAHETMACNEVKNAEGKTVLRAACGTKLSSVGYLRIAKDGKLTTGPVHLDGGHCRAEAAESDGRCGGRGGGAGRQARRNPSNRRCNLSGAALRQ